MFLKTINAAFGAVALSAAGLRGAFAQPSGAGTMTSGLTFNCAAFAFDNLNEAYGALVGYGTTEQAEAAVLAQCKEGATSDNCTIQISWCSSDCVAFAWSYDQVFYAWNTNPANPTKAAMHALNQCTQNTCDDPAWAAECGSGQPVCFVDSIVCGTEYQVCSCGFKIAKHGLRDYTFPLCLVVCCSKS